ncbi:MFS general substrate transporter [Diaporthe eres]|uniref:Major facilitator superfamily (MFS) profile domain-containing protein n=1 Tax=Diaporthe vaccinii TaxID=105482 RepID=A0ABR4FBR1_9PEZI|nr:MFS general substrate transporter [Diaporthe eres]
MAQCSTEGEEPWAHVDGTPREADPEPLPASPVAAESSTAPTGSQNTSKPYSIFSSRHRRILTAILGIASTASPLSANIYLPLLPLLQTQYRSSAQAINLTLTLYVVVQAVMPAFFAPAADAHGRRLISIITYIIFTVASLGLAVNDISGNRSYVALILLRAMSALGASACASITYGVVSDVCIPAQRGTMVGPAISAANVGTVLGPVIGGLIAWRTGGGAWVFFTLAIFGATSLVLMIFLLPETARSVVGDGSEGQRLEKTGWREFVLLGPRWDQRRGSEAEHGEGGGKESCGMAPGEKEVVKTQGQAASDAMKAKKIFVVPNPFSCLSIIISRDTALVLWLASCNYAVWYCVTASIPQIYADIYGWSELNIGLAYLPAAITIFASGFITGPWNNYKYKKTAREEGVPVDSHRVDGFPIEKARARQLWPSFFCTHLGIAGLGWAVQQRAHPAVPLVIQAITGCIQSTLFFAFNTLLVDVHPDRPSTASAAASLVRSGLSGIGVAILQPLTNALGWGWYFTLMALVVGCLQGVGIIVLLRWGRGWREQRRGAEEARKSVLTP